MSFTLTSATLPVFKAGLNNLTHCMSKAAANAASQGFSADAFLTLKLAHKLISRA
jgi:uncharacterized protein